MPTIYPSKPLSDWIFVQEKLNQLLSLRVKNIYFGGLGVSPPLGAFYQPTARFNFVLSGTRPVVLPIGDEVVEAFLHAGDVQISLPNSWELPRFNLAHEVLCIVPRRTHFRVAIHEYLENSTRVPGGFQYHTSGPASETLRDVCLSICSAATSGQSEGVRHLLAALKEFALHECMQSPDAPEHDKAEVLFKKINAWVENHFQEPINREFVADQFGISPSHVSRLYRRMTGRSFTEVLRQERIDFAVTLLAKTDLAIYQIATQCGFSNTAYFVKSFRQLCGESPGRLRRKLKLDSQ